MNYEQGLQQLKNRIRNTGYEQEFLIYEARLRETLDREGTIGQTDQTRSDRKEVMIHLNRVAAYVHVHFEELCRE